MVAIETDEHEIRVSIPTDGMSPGDVAIFVNWLRVELIARRSKLTEEAAWRISEDRTDSEAKTPPDPVPQESPVIADWKTDLLEVADLLIDCCRRVDPLSVDKALAEAGSGLL